MAGRDTDAANVKMRQSEERGKVARKRGFAKMKVWQLVLCLVVVVVGGVLFVGAASGWFSAPKKVTVDANYMCEGACGGFIDTSGVGFDDLMRDKQSFVIFVDQASCTTADRVREYVKKYAMDNKFRAFRVMFSETANSSLKDYIKYYPSVMLVSHGEVVDFLDAGADADAAMYNNYDDFAKWMDIYIIK